ncbi:purine and uridine phosphorylase [Fusarium acutatum]|uniref:Purine and uridine phosphorylase n=1 Tax=Fusarium acutatum TaxID=78861 RepID=A0A8H4NEJ8_9HYPO|nr:purine and uridine phosphorylase [Fusarium acutatum]
MTLKQGEGPYLTMTIRSDGPHKSCNILLSFPNIHIGLMVSISGGVPTTGNDVRLRDVVVGGLVIQYDLGKTVRVGKFERMSDTVKSPPDHLVAAVKSLQVGQDLQPSWVSGILVEVCAKHPLPFLIGSPTADQFI